MHTKLFRCFLPLTLFLFSACSTDDSAGAYPFSNDPTPDFSCIINDHPWVADSAVYTANGTTTIMSAYLAGRVQIRITLAGITAGIYPVTPGTNDFVYMPSATTVSSGTLGDIVISNYDSDREKITGTFDNISANGSAGWFNITDGYFINIKRKSPLFD